MRVLLPLLIIFSLFLAIGVWSVHSLANSAQELGKELEDIMQLAEQERWEIAQQQMDSFKKKWDERAKWWPVILDHQEIDNIEFALARTEQFLQSKNIDLSLGHLAELKLMIEHIPQKEAVTIENIF